MLVMLTQSSFDTADHTEGHLINHCATTRYGDNRQRNYAFTSASSGLVNAYRDGSLLGTTSMSCSGGEDALNNARTTHRIGGSTCGLVGCVGSGCHVYTGHFVMSYFGVFNRVLTSAELQVSASSVLRERVVPTQCYFEVC